MGEFKEMPLPEDFYKAEDWLESLLAHYSDKHHKLSRKALQEPARELSEAIQGVIDIYGNFSGDTHKLLSQAVNPLFAPHEYEDSVYKTMKEGAVNENNNSVDIMAEKLLHIRKIFERDRKYIAENYRTQIKLMDGNSIVEKEEKFTEIMGLIAKVHTLQVTKMVRKYCEEA